MEEKCLGGAEMERTLVLVESRSASCRVSFEPWIERVARRGKGKGLGRRIGQSTGHDATRRGA